RIVAKVDELMALCDKLEAQQQSRRKLQNNLRLSTLQAVASATSPHELQTTWARLSNNFGRLFHAPEDVADLRSLVLDLAVHGFLTEQSEDDTNAIKTFEDIKAVEKRLVADKNLGRPKPFQPLQENDIPFSLPNGWIWTRLGELAPDFQNGISKRHGNTGIATTVLRLADILKNQISLTEPRDILLTESERDKYLLEDGDILITRVNGSADLVGSFILVNAGGVAYCDHFIRLRFVNELIDVEYVWVASQSPFIRQQISGKFVTTAGQKTVNQNHIGSVLIPLPPIQEQHRIVKRVAELMRLCDSMESQLRHAKEVACRHAISAVSSLTGIAIGQEEEPMKAPQTELIASLRLGAAPDIKVQAPLATILARHNGEMSAKDLWRRFGGEIEAFYAQLKTEVAHGWILEPAPAEMREKPADAVSA
ncbi:restriction endonuclease subunit S, partial [Methyloversatilis sp.]